MPGTEPRSAACELRALPTLNSHEGQFGFFFFFVIIWVTLQCSGITPERLGETYVVPGINPVLLYARQHPVFFSIYLAPTVWNFYRINERIILLIIS